MCAQVVMIGSGASGTTKGKQPLCVACSYGLCLFGRWMCFLLAPASSVVLGVSFAVLQAAAITTQWSLREASCAPSSPTESFVNRFDLKESLGSVSFPGALVADLRDTARCVFEQLVGKRSSHQNSHRHQIQYPNMATAQGLALYERCVIVVECIWLRYSV